MIYSIKIEACARAAHEVNRAFCIAIGDTSQPSWDDAPEWQKASSFDSVRNVLTGKGPEELHVSWVAEKTAAGWKYGPVKDPGKKEHHCMVPYAELPVTQKLKDHLFVHTVHRLWAALGMV